MAAATSNSYDHGCTLRERLDELPLELWEMIYDFTFTAEAKIRMYSRETGSRYDFALTSAKLHELTQGYSKEIVTVNEIPCLLHIDRASRKKFAASFFGNANSLFVVSLGSVPEVITLLEQIKNPHMGIGRGETGVFDMVWRPCIAGWVGRPEESFAFINCEGIEALLKTRAGVTGEACA